MPTEPVDLGEALSQDSARCGAKAARLAQARAAGLPVLPGVVVPVDAGRPAIAAAASALRDGGSGAARLAAMGVAVPEQILTALQDAMDWLGTPVVVRSSSPLEGGGVWAGAFSSYDGIGRGDLGTALRGVWASAFTVHALERCEAAGMAPADLELAVLVQPEAAYRCGGSARMLPSGDVAVHATRGSLRDLMGGWQVGVEALVSHDGRIEGTEALAQLGSEPVRAAAGLARRVWSALGDDLTEWAWTGDAVILFQSSSVPVSAVEPAVAPVELVHGFALHLARGAQRFPGELGERLVLPWVLSLGVPPVPGEVVASTDPHRDLVAAEALASELTKEAWQERPERARRAAVSAFAVARGPDPDPSLSRLANLRPVDAAAGRRVVALLEGVGAALVDRGRLAHPRHLWRHSLDELHNLMGTASAAPRYPVRLGPDRWEPFIHAAIRAHGREISGSAVVPGIAAGRIVVVGRPHDPPEVSERDIVVAKRPLPALAPLLWNAGALVTTSGNAGAHLMEVATSLGVPTIVRARLTDKDELEELVRREHLAAVDGEAGVVSITTA